MDKRLLILTQYFPPEMGAPQSRLYETAMAFQALGWKVAIVTALPNYPSGQIFSDYRGRFSTKEDMNGLQVWRYWLYASNSRRALPRILSMLSFSFTVLFSWVRVRKFRPDYVLTESPPLTLGLSGLFLARITGARHILNVSDIWPLSASELGALSRGGWLYRMLERLERFLYRKAYACTGQSLEIVRHLESSGVKQAWLFRNGVDINRFPERGSDSKTGPLSLVYAGLLGVAQGILALCQSLEFDPSRLVFHIYGDGAEREAIEAYLQTTGKPGIQLHKPLSREAVPQMLSSHDLTLIPLIKPIYGAVPSKIYEAMAAGLPIIFAGGGEGAEIVKTYDLGWVCEPSDFSAMQRVLAEVGALSASAMAQKRANCVRAAREHFSRDIQIRQLAERLR